MRLGVNEATGKLDLIGIKNHNDLVGLQGGTTDEYYHLTAAEYGSGLAGQFVPYTGATNDVELATHTLGFAETYIAGVDPWTFLPLYNTKTVTYDVDGLTATNTGEVVTDAIYNVDLNGGKFNIIGSLDMTTSGGYTYLLANSGLLTNAPIVSDVTGTFGDVYQAIIGDDANTKAGDFTDGTNSITLADGNYSVTGNSGAWYIGYQGTGEANFTNSGGSVYLATIDKAIDVQSGDVQIYDKIYAQQLYMDIGNSALYIEQAVPAVGIKVQPSGSYDFEVLGTSYLRDIGGIWDMYFFSTSAIDGTVIGYDRQFILGHGDFAGQFTDAFSTVYLANGYGIEVDSSAGAFGIVIASNNNYPAIYGYDDMSLRSFSLCDSQNYVSLGYGAGNFSDGSNYVQLADGTYAVNAVGVIVTDTQINTPYIGNSGGSSIIDVDNGLMMDTSSGYGSVDWTNRYLYASDGSTVMLDWSTDGTADFQDNDITTTGRINNDMFTRIAIMRGI